DGIEEPCLGPVGGLVEGNLDAVDHHAAGDGDRHFGLVPADAHLKLDAPPFKLLFDVGPPRTAFFGALVKPVPLDDLGRLAPCGWRRGEQRDREPTHGGEPQPAVFDYSLPLRWFLKFWVPDRLKFSGNVTDREY